MKNALILLLFVELFGTCQMPEAQKDFKGIRQFRTTEPSRIYFKNLRTHDYFFERKPNTKIDQYRLKRFTKNSDRPILIPVIVNNWLEDEAYIFLQKNGFNAFSDTLFVRNNRERASSEFYIRYFNKENQFEFAGRIYEGLLNNEKLELKSLDGSWIPIFQNHGDKTNFLITLKDYYKLTALK